MFGINILTDSNHRNTGWEGEDISHNGVSDTWWRIGKIYIMNNL